MSIQYISTYSTGASLWTDTYFCLSDSAYELHYYCFNKKNRIVWAENPTTHEIVDAVLVDEQGVLTTGVTIKKEDGSQAVGTDITKISTFLIYKGETELMGVSSGSVIVTKTSQKNLDNIQHAPLKTRQETKLLLAPAEKPLLSQLVLPLMLPAI